MDLMKRIKNGVKGQKSNTPGARGNSASNRHHVSSGPSSVTTPSTPGQTIAEIGASSGSPGPSSLIGHTHSVQVHTSKSSIIAHTPTAPKATTNSLSNGNLVARKGSKSTTSKNNAHGNANNNVIVPAGPTSAHASSINRSQLRKSRPRGTWIEKFPEELPSIWVDLLQRNQICDGILASSDGKKHPIHRIILASSCPYFKTLFLSNPQATKLEGKPVYKVDMDSETLEQILAFSYSSHCVLNESNIRKLLPVSHNLHILGLTQRCFKFLQSQMTPQNCLDIWKFSKNYCCPKLRSEVKLFILYNFKQILKYEDYLELKFEEFEELIKDDMLNIRSEEIVFDSIKKWIEWKPKIRSPKLIELLHCVRWGLMSYRYFTAIVLPWQFVAENQAVQEALFEAQMFLASVDSRNGADIDLNDPLARPRVPYEIIFAIGGWSAGSPTSFMETYDARADRWFLTPGSDVTPRAYHGLVALGQLIYMVGGFDGNEHFNTVRCYNPITRTWTEKANMHFPRCYISCCALNGIIYAMGGFNGRSRMSSVERYDPTTNQWEILSPMNRQRSDASACALNGRVFVAGGFNGTEVLNSVEVYSVEEDQWTFIHPMRSPRSGVVIIGYNEMLYAIGGFNGFNRLQSVEKYDPQNPTHEWVNVAEMSSARSNFAASVIDDLIFVIGGFNGTTTIPYVECYDGAQNEWFDAAHMNLNRSALAACVLHGLPNGSEYSYLSRIQEILGLDNEINPPSQPQPQAQPAPAF